jgi:hypothetical protein
MNVKEPAPHADIKDLGEKTIVCVALNGTQKVQMVCYIGHSYDFQLLRSVWIY